MKVTEVEPGPVPQTVGVAVASFNEAITDRLLDGALAALEESGVAAVTVARVSGALELGVVVDALLEQGHDAAIAIGAVIKGETDHYEYVSSEAVRAITEVALRHRRPVGNAVLTVREYEQAVDRSLPGPSNKGGEAVEAMIRAHRAIAGIDSPAERTGS
jgi:6,7-dimethyl-8-ribityllumazine synthase